MPQPLISTLLQALPRHAEEGGLCYSVSRLTLIDTISSRHAVETCVAENTVLVCERLLETLSVLDSDYLSKGEWRFISFPAQLLATSVLTAMSDDESRLFAADFWNTQYTDISTRNNQREVLRYIEKARNNHHAQHQASPIRYCYVAWSIIKLDGNILFYQREDTQKRHDKTAGDYGLIGGRANQNDVFMNDKAALLKELQSPHSKVIKEALPETLKRELREEAGLDFELHYSFKPWRTLNPYRQVQGAAPNHALTEYYLEIFQIELNLDGYLFLLEKIKSDQRLTWFSLDEISQGESVDGKIAYIRALYDDFANDRAALRDALTTLPDSFISEYKFQPIKYGLTLSIRHNKPLLAGVLGKEKPLDLTFTEKQHSIFLGLAAHLRGFEFFSVAEGITLHPLGWIQVTKQSNIQSELIKLSESLKSTDLVIENTRDLFFRLSIVPEVVFFDESLFSLSVKQSDLKGEAAKISLSITRKGFNTALGDVREKIEAFTQSRSFARRLDKLASSQSSMDLDEERQTEDVYKKGLHTEPKFKALGLRNLIRQEGGLVKFAIPFIKS